MIDNKEILDFANLKESFEVEFKEAAGKNHSGGLPDNLWDSYSAMANTAGGYIVLGVKEHPNNSFSVSGIKNPDNVLKDFWNLINNTQKINRNLLSNHDVRVLAHEQKHIICIHVPRAKRHDKPIFKGQNPFTGSYRRLNDGDYRCPEHVVRQMLAEQTHDSLDEAICNKFTLDDIDRDSLQGYRQLFSNRQPNHPFNNLPEIEFLRQIGAYRRDRETEEAGLTLAGLLMFGKLRSILDRLPNYVVDYREYATEGLADRWIDRVTTDATWSGNLFDFCQKTLRKLTADLKVPFMLKDSIRVEESPVHVAVREALVNTLIHADYSGTSPILIVRKTECFKFRNPGNFRIPKETAITGGTMNSDCRNRGLQKMFQLIGFAEQAGSGFPKIFSGWQSQDWVQPDIQEDFELGLTRVVMRMESLYPPTAVEKAKNLLGETYSSLSELERLIIVTTLAEVNVNHSRIAELTSRHHADITAAFQHLIRLNYLSSSGHGRGTLYHFNEKLEIPSQERLWPSSSLNVNDKTSEVLSILKTPMKMSEIMQIMKMSNVSKFRNSHLRPLLVAELIQMTFPNNPNHPKQKYELTEKGKNYLKNKLSRDQVRDQAKLMKTID